MTLLQLWEQAVHAANGREYLVVKRRWNNDGTMSSVHIRVNNGYNILAMPTATNNTAVWFMRTPTGNSLGSSRGTFDQLMEDVNLLYALA